MKYDVVVIGGGFAGVTAAREAARGGGDVLLLEARTRLGGRTWTADWNGDRIEYGGGWVHWHQPHVWSEITRAGLPVRMSPEADVAAWYVDGVRREGTPAMRDAIVERGWNRFVEGADDALPLPYSPGAAGARLTSFDRKSVAARLDELDLDGEERSALVPELEAVTHSPLAEAGAVSVLRWHALSGRSLALTQEAVGRVTLAGGTIGLLTSIADGARFDVGLDAPVAAVAQTPSAVEIHDRHGRGYAARSAIVAVPLNTLSAIEFDPPLSTPKRQAVEAGQASRGLKLFVKAHGPRARQNAVRLGHPFGYLATERVYDDGTQLLIGFGAKSTSCDPADARLVQEQLSAILPGFDVVDATAHDWVSDEFSQGTWAIHRPGWYSQFHTEMQRPEGRVLLAGSDLANGWSGFIDGAIESGLRAGTWALRVGANR